MLYKPVEHAAVGFHRRMTNIEQEADKAQLLRMEEVFLDKLRPDLSALA